MKKNVKKVIILAIYLLLVFACTKVYATTGTITEETVRLREEASTSSNILVLVPEDSQVEIIETEGEWYKVKYVDEDTTYTGYIRQDLVEVEDADTEEEVADETTSDETTENTTDVENSETEETTDDVSETEEETTQEQSSDSESDTNSQSITITEGMKITITNKIETRILPLINTSTTGTISADTEIEITEIIGNWSYIQSQNQSGWVMTSSLKKVVETQEENTTTDVEDSETSEDDAENEEENEEEEQVEDNSEEETTTKELYVNVTTVNLREEANSSSTILKQLSVNTKVTVIEEVDSTWSKVEVSGVTGYIATEYLSETKTETTSRGSDETRTSTTTDDDDTDTETESTSASTSTSTSTTTTSSSENEDDSESSSSSSSSSSVTGSDVVAYAKTLLGCKYVYGGTSPSGFDCSGFTQYVYKHFGYSISRTSSSQRSDGIAVKKANLAAGDIVCFSGHVGIYIGSNKFIHAENASSGVTISSLSESYYTSTYITARRIIY